MYTVYSRVAAAVLYLIHGGVVQCTSACVWLIYSLDGCMVFVQYTVCIVCKPRNSKQRASDRACHRALHVLQVHATTH